MNFTSDSIPHFGSDNFDKVPENQISQLLRRRLPQQSNAVDETDVAAVKELESYCKSRGIMAMNLGHMHPREALRFLRNQLGDTSPMLKESKRGLLNG